MATPKDKNVDEKPIKVDKWDGAALKNALDDESKLVMSEQLGYVESHSLTDGRLVVCSIAVGFALFALLWDYLHPFPQSRTVLIVCVASYFLMMVVLTLYTTYKEKGQYMVALQKDKTGLDPDIKWTLTSCLKRYDDKYELYLTCTDENGTREEHFSNSVAKYFDENGYLCRDIFDKDFMEIHSRLLSSKKTN